MTHPSSKTPHAASALAAVDGETLSRRERRKLELHARIVATAAELFSERGFQATRVSEICECADIADKTFFNHFPTKHHVLREVAQAGVEQLLLDIESIRKAELGTRERLQQFFHTVAEHMAQAGPSKRELVTESVHVIADDANRSEQVQRLHAAFGAVVDDGLARGDVTRRHEPRALTEMILGAYYVLIFNYANLDDFPVRERAAAAAELLADALSPRPEEADEAEKSHDAA